MKDRSRAPSLVKTKGWAGVFVFALGLFAVGCGSEGIVSGKVLYQGKPLPGGSVTFMPSSGGPPVTSRIQTDGSYRVLKVPPGPAKITIVPPASSPNRKLPPGMARAMKSGKMKLSDEAKSKMSVEQKQLLEGSSSSEENVSLPAKYSDPEKSGLEYTVTSGSQAHDIELK